MGGPNETAAAAAAAAGPCLANLKALLNVSAGGDKAVQAAGLEGNSALAPLLASLHFSQQLQQQAALGEEGVQQPNQQQQALVAGMHAANPLAAAAEHWQVAAGSAVSPGVLAPNNENLIQYLSAFAALSAQNGNAAGAVGPWPHPELAAAIASVGAAAVGDVKAAAAQGVAPLGGIKGGTAKAVPKAKKGKKSSVSVSVITSVLMWHVFACVEEWTGRYRRVR